MTALFGDPTVLDDQNALAPAYGAEPVGDDEHGASLADAVHVLLNDKLRFIVQSAGGFVQNQNFRLRDQCPGDSDALPLTARQIAAVLTDRRIVALRHLYNEVVSAGHLRRPYDSLHIHTGIAEGNVVAHRAVEQIIFLQHHAYLPAQPERFDQSQIHAIDQHPSGSRHIQALDQFAQGAFAGTGMTDDADDFASGYLQTDVVQNFRMVRRVAETDMLEFDPPRKLRQGGAPWIIAGFGRAVEDVAQTLQRNSGLLKILP